MIDPAGSAPEIWRALFERLRQDASLQRLLGADAAACLVTATGDTVLATGTLRERVAAGWSDATRRRLQALIAGLAPSAGLRLERVTFGDGPQAISRTMATRRVKGPDGQPALLLVDVSTPSAPSRAAPAPPAATDPVAHSSGTQTAPFAPPAVDEGLTDEPVAALADKAAVPAPAETALPPRLRVLYESDADGRIGRIGADLPRLLGHPADAFEGRRWSDLVGRLVADPAPETPTDTSVSALAALVLADRTFANQPALWRLADGDEAYAGQVSGLPMRDAAKRFLGHRGFILIDTTARHAFPAVTALESVVSESAAPAAATPAQDLQQGEPEPIRDARPDNVVTLRQPVGRADQDEAAGARTGMPSDSGPDDAWPQPSADAAHPAGPRAEPPMRPAPPALMLSLSERNAFREIARALGARLEDDGEAETVPAETVPAAGPVTVQQAPEESSEAQPSQQQPSPETTEADAATTSPVTLASDQPQLSRSDDADEHPASAEASTDAAQPGHGETQAHPAGVSQPSASEAGLSDPVSAAEPMDSAGNVIRLVPPARPDPFQDLVDRLPMGVLVMREGRALFANRTLLDLVGHDDVAGINEGGVDRLFAGGVTAGGVVSLRTREGEIEPVDARMSGITFAGEPATLIAFRRAVETVDAARAEAAKLDAARAEQQARELSAILDTATDGVLTLDEHGRLLSLNRSAEALFGYDQREVIGENFTLLLAPESHLTALDYLEGLKGGGVASLLNDGREVVGRVRQGGRIPLSMTMGRVADGAERKFSAVLRDMTAWKRAETDLVEARRVAERASDQKSEVLAKISHEIRTPLNAIIGFTEVMSEERFGPIGNDRYKEYLQDIHQSGAYLISLVNDLLDLAKIEAGRMEMNFAAVSLNELIQQTVSLMQAEASRQRVVLRTGLHPRLPPVVADERSLRQIVLNLLSNAIKFTDPGGQVIISTKLGDRGELALSVRDTGIGMTEKELQQALEPFRQVSATRRGHGTGLGLPITKALVEANKGALAISSARNEGTLVEVTFPPQRVLAS